MKLICQVACGNCGKSHRIHRRLTRGIRYRFTCKRCGAVITFGTGCVRWACKPEDAGEETSSGRATITRSPHDTLEAMAAPRVALPPPLPPPIPRNDGPDDREEAPSVEHPVNDTMMDGRPPIHLTPLRRGVETTRESSRVRFLRQRWKTAASGC